MRLEADSEKIQQNYLKQLIKQDELGSLLSSAVAEISSTRNEKDLLIKQLQQVIFEIDNVQSELKAKDELILELKKTVDENNNIWNDRSKFNCELKDQLISLERELSEIRQSFLDLTESHVLLEQELAGKSKKLSERNLAMSSFEEIHESVKSQLKMVSLENANLVDQLEKISVEHKENLKHNLDIEESNALKEANLALTKRLSEVESQLELSKNLLITQDKRHRAALGEKEQLISEITQGNIEETIIIYIYGYQIDKEKILQHLESTQQELTETKQAQDYLKENLHAEREKLFNLQNYIEEKKVIVSKNQEIILTYITSLESALQKLAGYSYDLLEATPTASSHPVQL